MPEDNTRRSDAVKRFKEAEARHRARKKEEQPNPNGSGLLDQIKNFISKSSPGGFLIKGASEDTDRAVEHVREKRNQ
jgi:hypothetical protein